MAGVADVHDPFVWAACARFAALPEDVAQRVSAPGGGGAFLVLVYDAPPEARRAVLQPVGRRGGFGSATVRQPGLLGRIRRFDGLLLHSRGAPELLRGL